jgi:hypothetical protein
MEADAAAAPAAPAPAAAAAPVKAEKKVRVKKTALPLRCEGVAGADAKALNELLEAENAMAANDKLQVRAPVSAAACVLGCMCVCVCVFVGGSVC